MLQHLLHLAPLALAFTIVPLPDELVQKLKTAMKAVEPSTDDDAATTLATLAARGENYYIVRKPLGAPLRIAVEYGGKVLEYIFINEIVEGEHRFSLEDISG